MKSILSVIGTLLIGVLLTLGCVYVYESKVEPRTLSTENLSKLDSIVSAKIMEEINPVIYSVDEILTFRENLSTNKAGDEVLLTMPENVLKSVAGTCIRRSGMTSKLEIINEYVNNKNIYDYLPPDTTVQKDEPVGEKKILSTSYKQRTDTIDGKPVKIMIKTEESVE